MTFLEVDEALYRHEAPFYRSAATGGFFEATREWRLERERLTQLWLKLCPYKIAPAPPSLLERILAKLKLV